MGRGQPTSRRPLPIEGPSSKSGEAVRAYWISGASLAELSALFVTALIAESGECSIDELGDRLATLVQGPTPRPLLFSFGSHRSLNDLVQSLVLLGWLRRVQGDDAKPSPRLGPAGRGLVDTAPPDLGSRLGLACELGGEPKSCGQTS